MAAACRLIFAWCASLLLSASLAPAWAAEPDPAAPGYTSPLRGGISIRDGEFLPTAYQLGQPLDTGQPNDSTSATVGQPTDIDQNLSTASFTQSFDVPEELLGGRPTPNAGVAVGEVGRTEGAIDAGRILQNSSGVQTVDVQRRSPVSFDPRVRGFHLGQIYTQYDGANYMPVRQDLDTMLSKFDPSLIDSIVVIPGPYSVQYGPGFSFIDVIGVSTPRYANGPETHANLGMQYGTNGAQLYGRSTALGGGSDYGYIVNYGNLNGSDYQTGSPSIDIPSSYHNRYYLGQFGFDLSPEDSIEVKYNRLDQSDTEYAGQFFDVSFLTTDGASATYVHEDDCSCWSRVTIGGWYNRTRFAGDTFNDSKQTFFVIPRVENALGTPANTFFGATHGDLTSTGARMAATYGMPGDTQLTVGTDLHYLEQNINEQFNSIAPPEPFQINTNLPTSFWLDPGVYAALTIPVQSYWTSTIGARADWSRTSFRESELRDFSQLRLNPLDPESPVVGATQNDILWASYWTNQIQLSQGWTADFGVGYAERPPTLIERYADGVFISMIQDGFTRVVGTPTLDKERNTQFDVGLTADFDRWRGRIGGFQSFVNDYITFVGNFILDPTGARVLFTTNTELATLSGAEANGEYDLSRRWTAFGSARYIYGRDQQLDAPLPGIYPFDSRIGLRLHDRNGGRRWGIEGLARVVNQQNQLGVIRRVGSDLSSDAILVEERTPGFTIWNLRGYYNVTNNFNVVGGIDNVFNKKYLEHLDLRYQQQGVIPATAVLSPGFSPYMGVEWTY